MNIEFASFKESIKLLETLYPMNRNRTAFTLIELLVVISIIAVLVSLVLMLTPGMIARSNQAKSLANMRSIGAGFQSYANDNDFNLPARATSNKWPRLLNEYLNEPKVYADPGDPKNFLRLKNKDPLADSPNNTSYIMNGFNDRGAFENENLHVKLPSISQPSQTILLGMQSGSGNFYMDFREGNQKDVLDKVVFNGGANYLFVDGSVRFMTPTSYAENGGDTLWLADKSSEIPQ